MLTVAGISPSIDITAVVDRLGIGRIHRTEVVRRVAGGKSINCARAARTLGADVAVVAVLGGATGQLIAADLAASGIEVVVVPTEAETRICLSIGDEASGELTEVYQNAASVGADTWDSLVAQIAATTGVRPGWLAISGSVPAGAGTDALSRLAAATPPAGVRVALDSYGPAFAPAVAAGVDLIKINRSEAASLLGLDDATDLLAMARRLLDSSASIVVLTDGAAGAVGIDRSGAWRIPAAATPGGFPVGSGDSFLAGLVTTLDAGGDLPEALRWAAACGTANAAGPGAAVFARDDVARLAETITPVPA